MKKNKKIFLMLFSLIFTLVFAGCTGGISLNSNDSPLIPDGMNFNLNYDNDVNVKINDETIIDTTDHDTSEEDAENEEDEETDSSEEDTGDEDTPLDEDTDTEVSDDDQETESGDENDTDGSDPDDSSISVSEDGEYTSKEEVALYIHLYNHLPSNFITKNEAKELGWVSSKGNLPEVAPGKSIGGDKFGNREGLLPKKDGRQYYECDIDYVKGTRNSKRIVFSNDGLVYYTEDHYNTFDLLYE